jgi:HAD superfamily hydrolase (TIGR01509 family)
VSGDLRMIKPEPAIFKHALARIDRPAGSCLFIDDVAKNTDAAAALGFLVHRFTTPEALAADLRTRGLLS